MTKLLHKAELEEKLRKVLTGLNLAFRIEQKDKGESVACFVNRERHEARMTIALVREMHEDTLHATLAAFAIGVTEIRWRDGKSLCFSTEATPLELPKGDTKQ